MATKKIKKTGVRPDAATAEGQKMMQRNADQCIRDTLRTFNEIQQSGNPLTVEEVARLVKKRPERYGCLASWVKNRRD